MRGQRDHEAGAGDGHDRGAAAGCGRRSRCAARTAGLLRARIALAMLVDALHGSSAPAVAQHRDAAGDVVALDEVDGLGEFLRAVPRSAARSSLDVFDLNRIVGGQCGRACRASGMMAATAASCSARNRGSEVSR